MKCICTNLKARNEWLDREGLDAYALIYIFPKATRGRTSNQGMCVNWCGQRQRRRGCVRGFSRGRILWSWACVLCGWAATGPNLGPAPSTLLAIVS